MKISYSDFEKTMLDKLAHDGGKSQLTMINGGIMCLWLSDSKNGIINSRYSSLNCEFKILYAIYEKAISLGGEMYLGANAAQNGQRIGSDGSPVDTIDGFISIEFYGKNVGDKTLRRSTYFAAILDWAGFATNHRGGIITINKEFMSEDSDLLLILLLKNFSHLLTSKLGNSILNMPSILGMIMSEVSICIKTKF